MRRNDRRQARKLKTALDGANDLRRAQEDRLEAAFRLAQAKPEERKA